MPTAAQPDAPIFDPAAFRLTTAEADLTARVRAFGQEVLAPRAAQWDREAIFPTENYSDMHRNGLLAICVPKDEGGEGADFRPPYLHHGDWLTLRPRIFKAFGQRCPVLDAFGVSHDRMHVV